MTIVTWILDRYTRLGRLLPRTKNSHRFLGHELENTTNRRPSSYNWNTYPPKGRQHHPSVFVPASVRIVVLRTAWLVLIQVREEIGYPCKIFNLTSSVLSSTNKQKDWSGPSPLLGHRTASAHSSLWINRDRSLVSLSFLVPQIPHVLHLTPPTILLKSLKEHSGFSLTFQSISFNTLHSILSIILGSSIQVSRDLILTVLHQTRSLIHHHPHFFFHFFFVALSLNDFTSRSRITTQDSIRAQTVSSLLDSKLL